MDGNQLTLYLVCGAAILCSVVLVVGFFAFRFGFRTIGLFVRGIVQNEQEDEDAQRPVRLPRRKIDLRAKAQNYDFNAALAQAQADPANPPNVPPNPTPNPFDETPPLNPTSADFRNRLGRRRSRSESGEAYDAMYGDDEGDGGLLG